ncbi:MAG TPA: ATP-binding protein [Bacteroidia bacterium]|nr:ATP-binding protein [Bacteroidia bacterium]
MERRFTRWSVFLALNSVLLLVFWLMSIATHKSPSVPDSILWGGIAVTLVISTIIYNRMANQSKVLIDNNKKFLTFFDFSPTCICIAELDSGIILDANQAFLDLFGYQRQEAIGRSETSLGILLSESRARLIGELKKNGALKNREQIMFTKMGKPLNMLFSNIIIELYGKKCSLSLLNDISEKKELETQLIVAKEQAEKAAKIKEEFLANMSHEIRTPMNGVIGMAYLLTQTSLNDEQKEYARGIRDSASMLLTIINDILDISKINAAKMVFDETPFNVRDIIRNLSLAMEVKAREKTIKYYSNVEKSIPQKIVGDPVRLSQILWNLTGNAVKFTETGEVSLSVYLRGEENGTISIEFVVKDTGIGISPNKLISIFEPFTQASVDTSRKFGGTGLGLGIAKKLVEMQDGTIFAESKPGRGSTFSVRLTFKQYVEQFNVGAIAANGSTTLRNLNGIHILVAEDNKINQRVILKTLEKWGAKVSIAENGRVAIEMLTVKPYDIVLMDIQMPEMDGLEATKYIRSTLLPPASNLPIIAITASALRLDYEKCVALGMNEYVPKPFKPDELYDKIVRLLNNPTVLESHMQPQEV